MTARAVLYTPAPVSDIARWARHGTVSVQVARHDGCSAVVPVAAHASAPYDDVLAAFIARPLKSSMRPGLLFGQLDERGLLVLHDGRWRCKPRYASWTADAGRTAVPGFQALRVKDLVSAFGVVPGPVATALERPATPRAASVTSWLMGIHDALRLPARDMLRPDAEDPSATVFDPDESSVRHFDTLLRESRPESDMQVPRR